MSKTFGTYLRDFRREQGYTQEEAAHRAACSPKAWSHWECDRQLPSLPNLERIRFALGLSTRQVDLLVQSARR